MMPARGLSSPISRTMVIEWQDPSGHKGYIPHVGVTGLKAKGARVLRAMAIALIVGGLVLGLGAGWRWYAKVRQIAAAQQTLSTQWSGAPANPIRRAPADRITRAGAEAGTPIARLHLPTIGLALVVVEGADDAQLDKGPGRMTNTAPLGEPGNTALAGHRYPGVFWNLDQVELGEPVIVETATNWLVYRTVRTVIVDPIDETVLAAPDSGTATTVLTLITCEPKLSTSRRLVKQAALVRTDPRDGPRPEELKAEHRR
jgi:sortase A